MMGTREREMVLYDTPCMQTTIVMLFLLLAIVAVSVLGMKVYTIVKQLECTSKANRKCHHYNFD